MVVETVPAGSLHGTLQFGIVGGRLIGIDGQGTAIANRLFILAREPYDLRIGDGARGLQAQRRAASNGLRLRGYRRSRESCHCHRNGLRGTLAHRRIQLGNRIYDVNQRPTGSGVTDRTRITVGIVVAPQTPVRESRGSRVILILGAVRISTHIAGRAGGQGHRMIQGDILPIGVAPLQLGGRHQGAPLPQRHFRTEMAPQFIDSDCRVRREGIAVSVRIPIAIGAGDRLGSTHYRQIVCRIRITHNLFIIGFTAASRQDTEGRMVGGVGRIAEQVVVGVIPSDLGSLAWKFRGQDRLLSAGHAWGEGRDVRCRILIDDNRNGSGKGTAAETAGRYAGVAMSRTAGHIAGNRIGKAGVACDVLCGGKLAAHVSAAAAPRIIGGVAVAAVGGTAAAAIPAAAAAAAARATWI